MKDYMEPAFPSSEKEALQTEDLQNHRFNSFSCFTE